MTIQFLGHSHERLHSPLPHVCVKFDSPAARDGQFESKTVQLLFIDQDMGFKNNRECSF